MFHRTVTQLKFSFTILLSILFAVAGSAQTVKKDSAQVANLKGQSNISVVGEDFAKTGVYQIAQKMPVYPGGESELLKFISSNLKYPDEAMKQGIQGTVIVRFVINKDGTVENPEIMRGFELGCNAEALRVVKLMKQWIPGEQGGEKVSVYWTLPIKFKLTNTDTGLGSGTKAEGQQQDKKPVYPGGKSALYQFIAYNLKYPVEAQENGVQGIVVVGFVINKDGTVGNPRIIKSVNPACDAEAIRVIMRTKWIPGVKNGEKVSVDYTLPIEYKLQEDTQIINNNIY